LNTLLPVPHHVAIIMDGNGRWARARGLPRAEGHLAGTENVRRVLGAFADHGVKYVTIFAFSTENWGRPQPEVAAILDLLADSLRRETPRLHSEGVRIRHLGRVDRLTQRLRSAIRDSIELTRGNERLTLSVAFDYGGRAEIVDAIRGMVADKLAPSEITEETVGRYLYWQELPDPDLIIRTAGEMRLSNFLLWQSAYSEYYATPVLWPDFDEDEVAKALAVYGQRQRRYGKVAPGRPASTSP
jgi:undecaprenyl diphosphate synthase